MVKSKLYIFYLSFFSKRITFSSVLQCHNLLGHAVQLTKLLDEYIQIGFSIEIPLGNKRKEIGNYLVRDVRAVSVSVKASAGANYGR